LQDELYWFIKKGEEETETRIKFEAKINNLHSLHRSLEAKYARSLNDINMLESMNKFYVEERETLNNQNADLKTKQVEQERKISD
jgi:hypothetical protein